MNEETTEKLWSYYEDTMKKSIDLGLFLDFIPGDFDGF